jgi:hypothetical protein
MPINYLPSRVNRQRAIVIACVVTVHVVVALGLVVFARRVEAPLGRLAVFILAATQVSLLAVWSATSGFYSYVRFALAMFGLVGVWLVEQRGLDWDREDPIGACHAAMLAVQMTLVAVAISVVRLARWGLGGRRRTAAAGLAVQFSLRSAFGWLGSIAVVLGLVRWLLVHNGWTLDVVHSEFFGFGCVMAACHAVFALLTLSALLPRLTRWSIVYLAVALGIIAALGALQRALLWQLFGMDGKLAVQHWIAVAGLQAALLLASLVPVRLCEQSKPR